MTLVLLSFLLVAVGAVVVLPLVFAWLGMEGSAEWALALLRWPAIILVISVGLAMLYRFGPSRQDAQWCGSSSGDTAVGGRVRLVLLVLI